MIISWNVRGLSKKARCREVANHLNMLQASCCIFIETKVKEHNANKIQNWLGNEWSYADNYNCHPNGRLWIIWNREYQDITLTHKSRQHIHCVMNREQVNLNLTLIYRHNLLEKRKKLWKGIYSLAPQINGPWMLIGDYNNVLHLRDIIGGNDIHRTEYIELEYMMTNIGLYEHDTRGGHYTWSNIHQHGTIYSIIDRAIFNGEWFLKFPNCEMDVLLPHICDHSPLKVNLDKNKENHRTRPCFKFINCVTEREDYIVTIKENWKVPVEGRPVYILWRKLFRLQRIISTMNRETTEGVKNIQHYRENLAKVQSMLESVIP